MMTRTFEATAGNMLAEVPLASKHQTSSATVAISFCLNLVVVVADPDLCGQRA